MSEKQKTRQLAEHLHKMLATMIENSERAEAMTRAHMAVPNPTEEASKEFAEDMAFMQKNFDLAKAEIISKLDRIKRPAPVAEPPLPRLAQLIDNDAFDDIAARRGEDHDRPPRRRKRQTFEKADQTEDE